MSLDKITELYPDESILKADGFDEAVLGVDASSFNCPVRLVYSVSKCIEILMREEMSREEAVEYFDFNVRGAYVGETTPIWCDDDFE